MIVSSQATLGRGSRLPQLKVSSMTVAFGMARALCARMPAAAMHELKGVGTFCFTEEPALFGTFALPFLVRRASGP